MTTRYWNGIKAVCGTCRGIGKIHVPKVPEIILTEGELVSDSVIEVVDNTCPQCDGTGDYSEDTCH